MTQIAIVIPAYNEEKHIAGVVKRVKKTISKNKIDAKVIVVNDGSRDATRAEAKKGKADIILSHKVNLGKGGAAKTGCNYAYKKRFKTIILMDADGQHEPEDIPRFLEALKDKDIVYGYRTNEGESPLLMKIGNFGLTLLTKIMFGEKIKDTQSGFRAMTMRTYKKVRWESNMYGMETEMIMKAKGLKNEQIPIKTIYLDDLKGTTPIDGVRILTQMIKWKLIQIISGKNNNKW